MARHGVHALAAVTALALLAGAATADDTAPPPRFRDMQVTDLPPMVAPAPAPAAPPAAPSTGFWLQLGAFRERESADSLQAQAGRGMPALATQLRVFDEAGTHRLQAGPYPSREAAAGAAAQVRERLRIAPVVVERK